MWMTLAGVRYGRVSYTWEPPDESAVKLRGHPTSPFSLLSLLITALCSVDPWLGVLQLVCNSHIRWRVCRCLVENIYSREVFEEYWHRCAEAKRKAWSSGVIAEVFLDKVLGERQCDSALLPLKSC